MATLFHFHDPMCSWCWAFKPTWSEIEEALPEGLTVRRVLGGLAPDNAEPMPAQMRETIAGYWRHIETAVPGTQFNYDFWTRNTPRRATYPACRAVAAARLLAPEKEEALIARIQRAYYLEAKNPSDDAVLIALAEELGFDDSFSSMLNSEQVVDEFSADLQLCATYGVQGFPSLVLHAGEQAWRIRIDYNHADVSLQDIQSALASQAVQ